MTGDLVGALPLFEADLKCAPGADLVRSASSSHAVLDAADGRNDTSQASCACHAIRPLGVGADGSGVSGPR